MAETPRKGTPTGHEEPLTVVKIDEKASSQSLGPRDPASQDSAREESPYTTLRNKEKIFTIILASFAAFILPVSSSIYLPALNALAKELNVTSSRINITITVYILIQGLAPTFIGSISDKNGRRPAFLICFVLYLGANIGLALQKNYAALMVLRCLQASGSIELPFTGIFLPASGQLAADIHNSGGTVVGSAVVADIVTHAERGKYIGYASMGVTLGPALGPIIGGLLTHYLGWRSIFWFLTIFASVMTILLILVFPETSCSVVGNGSVPPQKWNYSVLGLFRRCRQSKADLHIELKTVVKRKRRPNLLEAVKIAFQKEAGMILFYGTLLYSGSSAVLAGLPSQLQAKFQFNSLQIGLCFLPYGLGSMTSRWTVGTMMDWNYRRHARRLGIEIVKNRQQKLSNFPIETARLQITLSLVLNFQTNLTGPMITLFLTGHTATRAFSSLNTLIIDINVESPATASAADNLVRCPFGAGAVAAVVPLTNRIGMGWTCTFVAGIWICFSPMILVVFIWGHQWREEKRLKNETQADQDVEIGVQVVPDERTEQEKRA